ncbi:MAG: hypothetical protein ACLUHA_11465 [Bacteroides stercoris]
MRINFNRHFLQPELSYTINRCNITIRRSRCPKTHPKAAYPKWPLSPRLSTALRFP